MSRRIVILGAVMALLLVLAGGVGIASGPASDKPAISADFSAAVVGRNIVYSISLHNNSEYAIDNIFVAGLIPPGSEFVERVATPSGALWRNADGSAASWFSFGLPAGGRQGPFKYKVTKPATPSPANAWVSWTKPTQGNSASSPVLETTYPLAKVRALNSMDHVSYPDGQVYITFTAGGHDQDKIVTSGLPNVGVGEYIYLQGAERDADGDRVIGWDWQLISKPPYSTAALESADGRTPRLKTDKIGAYEVKVTVTDEVLTKSSSILKVNAGRYAGAQSCGQCHNGALASDTYTPWAETSHATMFERTFPRYSKTSDYCVACHTTGYNELTNNGGIADAARASGWDPKRDGSFMAWVQTKGLKLADLKADPNIGKFLGIQCENCHGPGRDAHTKAKSYEPGVCGQCHGEPGHPQQIQWRNSAHAKPIYAGARANPDCVGCHTAQGFVVQKVKGQDPKFPAATGLSNLPQPAEMTNITCATCHDPHRATNPYDKAGMAQSMQLRLSGPTTTPGGDLIQVQGSSGLCVTCHANKRDAKYKADFIAGNNVRGVHDNAQADNYFATPNSYYNYGGKLAVASSAHDRVVQGACVECHMARPPIDNPGPDGVAGTRDDVLVMNVGAHSFQTANTWNLETHRPDPKGKRIENIATCTKCHAGLDTFNRKARADYDGNGKVEGIQDEVKGLLKALGDKLPKDARGNVLTYPITAENTTAAQRMALWNYLLVANDKSYGVHNAGFAVSLLQKTYKQFVGVDVPGATLR